MNSTEVTFEQEEGDLSSSMPSLPTSLPHRLKPIARCSIKMTIFLKPQTRPFLFVNLFTEKVIKKSVQVKSHFVMIFNESLFKIDGGEFMKLDLSQEIRDM